RRRRAPLHPRRRLLRPHRAAGRRRRVGGGGVTAATRSATGPIWVLRASWTEALRHLRAAPRSPEPLVFAVIPQVMFVLLFVYVLGGSLVIPGYDDYTQYLVPGIFAQTVLFGSAFTGVGVAEDLSKGIIDRLRSLPISPASVLIGRTISDLARNALT